MFPAVVVTLLPALCTAVSTWCLCRWNKWPQDGVCPTKMPTRVRSLYFFASQHNCSYWDHFAFKLVACHAFTAPWCLFLNSPSLGVYSIECSGYSYPFAVLINCSLWKWSAVRELGLELQPLSCSVYTIYYYKLSWNVFSLRISICG